MTWVLLAVAWCLAGPALALLVAGGIREAERRRARPGQPPAWLSPRAAGPHPDRSTPPRDRDDWIALGLFTLFAIGLLAYTLWMRDRVWVQA